MSDLRVTNLKGRNAGEAPTLPDGVVITGVATAGTFSGNLTGNVTGNVTGNATGLSGSPNITVTNVSAQDVQVGGALTVTGNLTVNGTQTIIL